MFDIEDIRYRYSNIDIDIEQDIEDIYQENDTIIDANGKETKNLFKDFER